MIETGKYIGTGWVHGSDDCYGLLRKFYKLEYEIDLTNYARPDLWWEKEGFDLYSDNYHAEGFRVVPGPINSAVEGDVFLMAVLSPKINHCAIYLGGNKILHHPYGKFSEVHNLTSAYHSKICAHIRHPLVAQRKAPPEVIGFEALLPRGKWEALKNAIPK